VKVTPVLPGERWSPSGGNLPVLIFAIAGAPAPARAIASDLMLHPAAVLLDEQFTSLYILLKRETLVLLEGLVEERRLPTLCVTHDPRDAVALVRNTS